MKLRSTHSGFIAAPASPARERSACKHLLPDGGPSTGHRVTHVPGRPRTYTVVTAYPEPDEQRGACSRAVPAGAGRGQLGEAFLPQVTVRLRQ